MRTYALPVIGERSVDEIRTEDVLTILSPIWTEKTDTAKRAQGRMENTLDYAAAHQFRDQNNPAKWRLRTSSKTKLRPHIGAVIYFTSAA